MRGEVRSAVVVNDSSTQQHSPSQSSIFSLLCLRRCEKSSRLSANAQIGSIEEKGIIFLYSVSSQKVLSICSFVTPQPFYPILQPVCSVLWGLCGGHLSHRAGDACRGRCVPPALLHLQRLFLPPADRRPLCPQGGTVTVCQRGLPPVSGQSDFLRHRYCTSCLQCACLCIYYCL